MGERSDPEKGAPSISSENFSIDLLVDNVSHKTIVGGFQYINVPLGTLKCHNMLFNFILLSDRKCNGLHMYL